MANFGFIIDNRRCIGCHACTVACKSEHDVPIGVNRTWVKYIEKGEFPNSTRLFSVMRCNHCDDAPCVEICPVTALYRRPDGIVDFDNQRCIGCKACMQACPYDALYIDPNTRTAAKCNYCAHRVDIGLEPACVNVCPTQAIISGDLDDPNSKISQLKNRHQVTARKVEKGTKPALFYINGDQASLEPTETSLSGESMWGSQSAGVGHWAADHGTHALDRLGALLNFGDSTNMTVASKDQPKTVQTRKAEELLDAVGPAPRRAYDAPQKGVLWGWQVSGYLWTKAIAAGVCLVPLTAKTLGLADFGTTGEIIAILIALIFLAVTGLLLLLDLDQPKRFLYVLLRPQWRSWLVKGAYIITAFGLLLTLYMIARIVAEPGVVEAILRLPLIVAAFLSAVYTAFLFAQAKGRDFWQSPLLPVHMLNHSLMAGAAVFALLSPLLGIDSVSNFVRLTLMATIGIHLLGSVFELYIDHPTTSAKKTALSIRSGRYAILFWGGSIIAGGLLPLLMANSLTLTWLPIIGLLVLGGVLISQHILVRAPQQIPLS